MEVISWSSEFKERDSYRKGRQLFYNNFKGGHGNLMLRPFHKKHLSIELQILFLL